MIIRVLLVLFGFTQCRTLEDQDLTDECPQVNLPRYIRTNEVNMKNGYIEKLLLNLFCSVEALASVCLYDCALNSKDCIEACQSDTNCNNECYRIDVQCHDGK